MVRGKGDGIIRTFENSRKCFITHANSMFRRKDMGETRYDPALDRGEDLDFMSRCFSGKKYLVTDEILYYYSEFDSFSLQKLPRIYKEEIRLALKEKKQDVNYPAMILKYILSLTIYPLMGSERVLQLRGKAASTEEEKSFKETYAQIMSLCHAEK
ncbi:MAG: hypothetical protein LIP01_01715 [Tannerellaceae bacterium]|nr:hypothetical protein [Tannerellaceae bacterium]